MRSHVLCAVVVSVKLLLLATLEVWQGWGCWGVRSMTCRLAALDCTVMADMARIWSVRKAAANSGNGFGCMCDRMMRFCSPGTSLFTSVLVHWPEGSFVQRNDRYDVIYDIVNFRPIAALDNVVSSVGTVVLYHATAE